MAGQVWAVSSLGGYMYADELSDKLRTALQPLCKWRQLCDIPDFTSKGKKRGDLFTWDVYGDVATQGTTLTETSSIPETNFTISQGTGTLSEYGNSVPYSGKLDDLSYHPVLAIVRKVLMNDAKKALDQAAYNQFNACALRVVPASSGTSTTSLTLTTNGTCTGTNTIALGTSHVKLIVDTMKERNIPPFVDDDYVAVAHPTTWRTLKNSLETLHSYVDRGFSMILAGEIGRYEGVRFIEQTNIAKANWSTGLSNQAFFMGEDLVAEAPVIPEEVRGKIPTDFGRSRGVAWYALTGFAIVQTQAAQCRIVKWDSAA